MLTEMIDILAVGWCIPFCVEFMPSYDWSDWIDDV